MKYNKKFCKIKFGWFLLICTFFSYTALSQDKIEENKELINLTIKVVDTAGNVIPGAHITFAEEVEYAITNDSGIASFESYPDNFITVISPGYERKVVPVNSIISNDTVILSESILFNTSTDEIVLPFTHLSKRRITGSTSLVTGYELEKYPSIDIRNAFTGLAPGIRVIERNGQSGFSAEEKNGTYRISEKIGITSRGGNMVYIVDGIFTDITEMTLNPNEIESVTIIKDIVEKAMFGPAGASGIMLIKTKRGNVGEKLFNVNIETGISVIDRMPEWTKGADYARLNNMARIASNRSLNYSESDIHHYEKNDPYDMYYPSVDYRNLIIKNTRNLRRATISSKGGGENIQYYNNIIYDGEDDIYKIGNISDYNSIAARSNLDIEINGFLKAQFDIYGAMTFRRSPNYGYATSEGSSATDLVEFNSIILDITDVPPVEFPIYANNDLDLESPWFAVSNSYRYNPIGNMMGQGYYTEKSRIGTANLSLDYDMSNLIKGFKSKTSLSMHLNNILRLGKSEDYNAYIVNSGKTLTGNDTIRLTRMRGSVDDPNLINLHDYYFQRFSFSENISFERTLDDHYIQSSLTYYLYKVSKNGIRDPERQQNNIFSGLYSYKNKYSLQIVLNYAGSVSIQKQNRYELFPSIGASWVISSENFMSNIKFFDYLKFRSQIGVLGVESFTSPYRYLEGWTRSTGSAFGPHTANQWFGSYVESTVYRSYPTRIENPQYSWEKLKEFSAGIDALFYNKKLLMEFTYYNNLQFDQISQRSNIPYLIGISSALPYLNLNSTRYFGFETALQYTDRFQEFHYSIGGNATIQNSKRVKYDEPSYRYDYQFREGTAADSYWGHVSLGKFESNTEANEIPQLYDELLGEGDLKYKDMNNDGVVDDNDLVVIGHTSPRLYYALNLNVYFKRVELSAIGTGNAFLDLPLTNKYFHNGWGDNNYSNFVRDNIGEAYPKLTYDRINNNFVASDFWLTRGDFFKIQNVELAYNIPIKKLQMLSSKGARFYIRGANLLTISKIKNVDPESINSGVTIYPLFKTFTCGVKLTF